VQTRWLLRLLLSACAALLAGCGESPRDVFKELKRAALAKDAQAVWQRLTPSTKKAVAARAAAFFSDLPGAGAAAGGPQEADAEVFEYFSGLMAGLDVESVEYIRSLRISKVSEEGGKATMTLASLRFGAPEKPIVFEKTGGKWLWDAREILDMYLEKRWR
jgi:hypothetical protein